MTWISGCKPLKLNPINLLHYFFFLIFPLFFFFYKTLNFDNKSINYFLSILRIKWINGSYWCYSQTHPRVFLTLRIAEILIQLSKYPTLSAIVVKELVHKCFFFFFWGGGVGGGGCKSILRRLESTYCRDYRREGYSRQ